MLPPILKMRPHVRPMPWGGTALARLYGKDLPAGGKIGETWEVADRPEGWSVVAEGPLAGTPIPDLYRRDPRGLTGLADPPKRFPLLVKFLDAADWLSLQVHPDEEAARKLVVEPKTECWVIVAARPDAFLYLGLAAGKRAEDLRAALAEGRPETALARVRVAAGDFLFVPAGTVHAIGPGIVLAEIQQNSDTTFRLSDWNRAGPDGKARPLHVEKGLSCVRSDPRAGKLSALTGRSGPYVMDGLIECPAFSMNRLIFSGPHPLAPSPLVQCVGILAGSGTVRSGKTDLPFAPGDWILATPAAAVEVIPEGSTTLLVARPGPV